MNNTESHPLKGVAWEKCDNLDSLRAQRPVNEVAKATPGFGVLKTLTDEFPKGM